MVSHYSARIPKDRRILGDFGLSFFNQYKRYSPFELVVIAHWREGERKKVGGEGGLSKHFGIYILPSFPPSLPASLLALANYCVMTNHNHTEITLHELSTRPVSRSGDMVPPLYNVKGLYSGDSVMCTIWFR